MHHVLIQFEEKEITMSTLTKTWDEKKIRSLIRNLDRKTGFNAAEEARIVLANKAGAIACFQSKGEDSFWFRPSFFNDPSTPEAAAINVVRHEFAHMIVRKINQFWPNSRQEPPHGKMWKSACKIVGALPKRCYDPADFKDMHLTVEEAEAAYNAMDIKAFDVFSFIKKWGQLPIDDDVAEKMLLQIRNNHPEGYYEIGDQVYHPVRGYGTVLLTIPFNYWTQKICVCFANDNSETVYKNKDICKIVGGKIVPYRSNVNKTPESSQLSIDDIFPALFD